MNIEVRKLTPEDAEAYVEFFDTTPHDDHVPEHTCYCVNWCNANTKSDCINCAGLVFALPDLQKVVSAPEEKVKVIYCFMVAEEYQRQGVACRLLQAVCEDAKKEGFDYIEAYPQKDASVTWMQFMGFDELYKKEGFEHYEELDDKYVVRKYL